MSTPILEITPAVADFIGGVALGLRELREGECLIVRYPVMGVPVRLEFALRCIEVQPDADATLTANRAELLSGIEEANVPLAFGKEHGKMLRRQVAEHGRRHS